MQSSDLPHVVAMLGSSFEPGLRPYMTYTQHGIMAFLELHMLHPESFPDKVFFVSTDKNDQAIGYAEFRLNTAKVGFLSYVCVAEHSRGLGIATSLIEHFIFSRQFLERLELDVFENNSPALRLYQKLGFERHEQKTWLQRPLPPPSAPLAIPQFHTSTATHAAYGFGELPVNWRGHEVRLGRIGTSVLRCYDLESFSDDDLLASARATIPSLREVLTILMVGDFDALPPDTVTLALSNRLAKTFGSKTDPLG
jgi:RimJ/RimL family protein N-acetyltransferase